MSTGTFVWEESEASLPLKSVFELASRPDQFFSVTCSEAERQRRSTEYSQPVLELPQLTPHEKENGDQWSPFEIRTSLPSPSLKQRADPELSTLIS
jgi:hypothetical protein